MDINTSIAFLKKAGIQGVVDGYATGPCVICKKELSAMNSHHTVPQACGGEHSLQVSLCAQHHDVLHYHGLALVGSINKKKKIIKQFWETEDLEHQAKPLLQVLVSSLIAKKNKETEGTAQFIIKDNLGLKKYVKLLQQDLKSIGIKTQEDTLTFCLINTLVSRGILNENQAHKFMRSMQVSEPS